MIINGVEYTPVTEDPELADLLFSRWRDGTDSEGLAKYAHSLGLTPPAHPEDEVPPTIVELALQGGERLLVWNTFETDEVDIDEGRH